MVFIKYCAYETPLNLSFNNIIMSLNVRTTNPGRQHWSEQRINSELISNILSPSKSHLKTKKSPSKSPP